MESERSDAWVHDAAILAADVGGEAAPPSPPPPSCVGPPPPPPSPATEALAAAVAEAARAAVEAEFEALRPALLQAIAAQVARGLTGRALSGGADQRKGRMRTSVLLRAGTTPPPKPKAGGRPHSWQSEGRSQHRRIFDSPWETVGSDEGMAMADQASCESQASMASRVSKEVSLSPASSPTPGASLYSMHVPTVQTLQADVAVALLERSGFLGQQSPIGATPRPTDSDSECTSSIGWGRFTLTQPDRRLAQQRAAASEGASAKHTYDSFNNLLPHQLDAGADSDPECSTREKMETIRPMGSSRCLTSRQVLQARVDELANEASKSTEVSLMRPNSTATPRTMRFAGMIAWDRDRHPCKSVAYQWAVRTGVAIAVLAFFLPSLTTVAPVWLRDCSNHGAACLNDGDGVYFSQLFLPAGAMLALIPCSLSLHQRRIEETFSLVRSVAASRGYRDWETRKIRFDRGVFVFLWCCAVGAEALHAQSTAGGRRSMQRSLERLALVAIYAAVIFSLSYGMVSICRSLIVMIDAFCCDMISATRLGEVAHVWNLTQAVLRKASTDMEGCLFVLGLILASSVPFLAIGVGVLGAQGDEVPAFFPGICVTCGILYSLLLSAMISEKCARVPALVNSLCFGEGTERARQHTVDYITSSGAGFYVFGMRLTTTVVAKFVYVWCVVVVGLLTRWVSLDSR